MSKWGLPEKQLRSGLSPVDSFSFPISIPVNIANNLRHINIFKLWILNVFQIILYFYFNANEGILAPGEISSLEGHELNQALLFEDNKDLL